MKENSAYQFSVFCSQVIWWWLWIRGASSPRRDWENGKTGHIRPVCVKLRNLGLFFLGNRKQQGDRGPPGIRESTHGSKDTERKEFWHLSDDYSVESLCVCVSVAINQYCSGVWCNNASVFTQKTMSLPPALSSAEAKDSKLKKDSRKIS